MQNNQHPSLLHLPSCAWNTFRPMLTIFEDQNNLRKTNHEMRARMKCTVAELYDFCTSYYRDAIANTEYYDELESEEDESTGTENEESSTENQASEENHIIDIQSDEVKDPTAVVKMWLEAIRRGNVEHYETLKVFGILRVIPRNQYKDAQDMAKDIVIPEGVRKIEDAAFIGSGIENVILPQTLEEIGNYAFTRNRLSSITFGNSLTTIGKSAFSWNRLKHLKIPSNIKTIGYECFSSNQLEDVDINEISDDIRWGAPFVPGNFKLDKMIRTIV